jgi:uncharacterized membrane protein
MQKDRKKIRYLVQAAVVAAIYAAMTYALAPISYGLVQVRISEALCVLPALMPAAVPGLFVGCLIANLLGGFGLLDIVAGSLATLIAAYCTYRLRRHIWLIPLPAVAINALVIGYVLNISLSMPYPVAAAYVFAGQAVACYGVGIPLYLTLRKYGGKMFGSAGADET